MMSIDMSTHASFTATTRLRLLAVSLSILVVALAFIAWGQTSAWHLQHLSIYRLFPIFGLWAFSLLLVQYVMLALVYKCQVPAGQLRPYFTWSGYGVLACILIHPSLLIGQLWHDGFGLPPASYKHFVAAGSEWLVTLGMLSLFIFLAYELHRWFNDRTWWKYVFYASDLAMLLIFFHGLRLGDELMNGWYHWLWYVYGLVLVTALVYIRTRKSLSDTER
jgi:hypothetical protein